MNLSARRILCLAAIFGAGHLFSAALAAQAVTNRETPARPGLAVGRPAATELATPPKPSPAPPLSSSPIAFFRELLAMNVIERQQALTNRSPESRSVILQKVREYESLKADERELRLSVTELRWYLRPLMTTSLTNRATLLAMIPQPTRDLVESRLSEWDQVPSDVQVQLLRIEPTLQYFTEIDGLSEQKRLELVRSISPARQKLLEKGIDEWHAMSEDQRRSTLQQFYQFFQLNPNEKRKALNTLSEPERQQIEKTLKTFGSLPPAQRAQCVRSFAKFASLSLEERQQFLKNAERWKQMSPTERQAWRQLVSHLPPPLPRRPPPLPPSVPRSRPTPTMVTNGN
jgi:hypothetical protein